MPDDRQFCTFALADMYLGVEVMVVQEVIRYQAMTRVPLAPPAVSGLINLRGQIVTAIDLRTRFGLPPRPAGELPMNVVIRAADGPMCLLVDEIGDVVEVPADAFERPPETLRGTARKLVRGAYKLRDRLLLPLDTDAAVAVHAAAAD